MDNLLSIIIVVLNDQHKIENTIISILNQKITKREIIVIDGGSTDGTLEILKKYKNNFKKLISEKDDGLYYAMNKALQYVDGNALLFFKTGDLL